MWTGYSQAGKPGRIAQEGIPKTIRPRPRARPHRGLELQLNQPPNFTPTVIGTKVVLLPSVKTLWKRASRKIVALPAA